MGPLNEYLGVAVAVNLDPDIETIVAWTSIHTGAGILGVHHSIPYITSLVTAVGIMRSTTNLQEMECTAEQRLYLQFKRLSHIGIF